jgi:hypothetical protein
VNQVSHQLGFTDEVAQEHGLIQEMFADQFDGNSFGKIPGTMLAGFINDTHSAFSYLADKFVAEMIVDVDALVHGKPCRRLSIQSIPTLPEGLPVAQSPVKSRVGPLM